ncbi:MAG: hypothetical protein ABR583_06150 [Gaiellaceae bacterium]
MRRVVGLLVLALGLVSAASGAGTTEWEKLPYIDSISGRLAVSTDGSWTGADAVNVGRFKAAPWNDNFFAKVPRAYIWGPRCSRGRERRTFTKTFLALGKPIEGTFNFAYAPAWPTTGRPWEGAIMRVNGVEVSRLPRTMGVGNVFSYRYGPLPAKVRQAFRYGSNTISITATKAPLKKGQRCNDPKVPRYVGVIGDLYAQFGADLRTRPPWCRSRSCATSSTGRRSAWSARY